MTDTFSYDTHTNTRAFATPDERLVAVNAWHREDVIPGVGILLTLPAARDLLNALTEAVAEIDARDAADDSARNCFHCGRLCETQRYDPKHDATFPCNYCERQGVQALAGNHTGA